MKISELVSKKIYAIYEGNEVGFVLNISLMEDLNKLDYFVVVALAEEREMILKAEDVVAITQEAVFIKSEGVLFFDTSLAPNNPLGKKIFSVKGDSLGRVEDVEIDGLKVVKILGSTCEILTKNIFSSGNDCLFFASSRMKKKIAKKEAKPEQEISLPFKQKGQGMTLLGKIIKTDVVDESHIVVFRHNSEVSPKVLIEAKKKGLLKKLAESIY